MPEQDAIIYNHLKRCSKHFDRILPGFLQLSYHGEDLQIKATEILVMEILKGMLKKSENTVCKSQQLDPSCKNIRSNARAQ